MELSVYKLLWLDFLVNKMFLIFNHGAMCNGSSFHPSLFFCCVVQYSIVGIHHSLIQFLETVYLLLLVIAINNKAAIFA